MQLELDWWLTPSQVEGRDVGMPWERLAVILRALLLCHLKIPPVLMFAPPRIPF